MHQNEDKKSKKNAYAISYESFFFKKTFLTILFLKNMFGMVEIDTKKSFDWIIL